MFHLTCDGERYSTVEGADALEAFWEAVAEFVFCPGLEDANGTLVLSWRNDTDERTGIDLLFGPEPEPYEEDGPDRVWEEHNYKFGSSRF